jgi:fructokinase
MTLSSSSAGHVPLLAAIDAGGTTFKCAIAKMGGGIIASQRFPTRSPEETLSACSDFFLQHMTDENNLQALGIAAFGPLDVDSSSAHFGSILKTPKPGWSGVNLKAEFERRLSLPVNIDTDVNGALLAEMKWGAARECHSAAYVTIGTGIGAGIYANGDLLGKPHHPEFGHISVRRHILDRDFKGLCPFHTDCLEGLASAKALTHRFGDPKALSIYHKGWNIIANYLAQACMSLTLTARPERIILGGGLMLAPHLIGAVRKEFFSLMNGYLNQSLDDVNALIVLPVLGDDAGLWGGVKLAKDLARRV